MALSTETMLELEQKFNSIDQTDAYHGPTRNGVLPYKGQTPESISEVARADSQVYPTINDDALVFKWAFNDMVVNGGMISNDDVFQYLTGKMELAELKQLYPYENPFYPLFQKVVEGPRGTKRIDRLERYYERLGFVGHYYMFIRQDSSLYRAFTGQIPLIPELFAHGVSARLNHESSVLFQEQLSDIDYLKNPHAPRLVAGHDLGWTSAQLIEAIRVKGGEIPAFLVKQKKWKVDEDNTAAIEKLESLQYDLGTDENGHNQTIYKYAPQDEYWAFEGITSGMHAYDDYYPLNEVPAQIIPDRNAVFDVRQLKWFNVPKANILAVYRHLYFGSHKTPIPEPATINDQVVLENYLRTDLPEKYIFRQDVLGYMRLYKHIDDVFSGEVPNMLWRDLTGLRSYTELYPIRVNIDPEVFIATAKRLGIRNFPDNGKIESLEKNCRAINRVIQYLAGVSVTPEPSLRQSVSARARTRRTARQGESKFKLLSPRSPQDVADVEQQDKASIAATSSPGTPQSSTGFKFVPPQPSGPSPMMLAVPSNFSFRPTSSSSTFSFPK